MGKKDSLVDYVHVDNLAYAHCLAAQKLLQQQQLSKSHTNHRINNGITNNTVPKERKVDGEAFFISDHHPVNNFEFLRPLVLALGYRYPNLRVSTTMMFYLAMIIGMLLSFFCF
jgi:hypothetical protein